MPWHFSVRHDREALQLYYFPGSINNEYSGYKEQRETMVVTGELIRMMNYVDDIAATLRRIQAGLPSMTDEERRRLADYMRQADPNYVAIMEGLAKG
jgi:hypothetical protein